MDHPNDPSKPSPDWAGLVERIATGDRSAEEAIRGVFGPGLRFYFTHHLGVNDVDDQVRDTQAAVVTAIRAGQVRDPDRLPQFVRTTAQRLLDSARPPSRRAAYPANAPSIPGSQHGRRFLEALSETDREILVRFYVEQESAEQLCAELRLSEVEFRSRKNGAKEGLSWTVRKLLKRGTIPSSADFMRKNKAAGH